MTLSWFESPNLLRSHITIASALRFSFLGWDLRPVHYSWTTAILVNALGVSNFTNVVAFFTVFTVRLRMIKHGIAQLLSHFRLSVCLSVKCQHCDNTKQSTAKILIPFHLVFLTRMVGGDDAFYLKFWKFKNCASKTPIFKRYPLSCVAA